MNKFIDKSEPDTAISQPNFINLLDFCKGLAITWIFLYHYKAGWFGWQGVHIFIVLSGFGLTYSCLKKGGTIAWKQWYLKRAERILPAYWLVCLSGFAIALCFYLIKGQDIVANLIKSVINLVLEILLLKNLSYQTMFMPLPNDPLWFIPLVVGCYLVFPWLYHLISKCNTTKDYLSILLGVAAIEFIYRAISIYGLDGFPVGFENPDIIAQQLSFPLVEPLNQLPDTFLMPFQLQAPFGLFPSRIAEFMVGMIGASLFIKHSHTSFINYRMGVAGVLIWLSGYALVFAGLWGWIFADFLITLGLVLWVVNLARICYHRFPWLFLKLSQIGVWSYYIFLTHHTFLYLSGEIKAQLTVDNNLVIIIQLFFLLGLSMIGTAIASWLLIKFDKSRFSRLIIQNSVARFLL